MSAVAVADLSEALLMSRPAICPRCPRWKKAYQHSKGRGVFCDADAVGEGLLTGFLPSQTHLVHGELCLGGALGGVESCGNLSNRSPAQGKRDVLLELALQCLPRHTRVAEVRGEEVRWLK